MSTIFLLIGFLAFISLVVGLFRPSIFTPLFRRTLSRIKLTGIFLGIFFASFIGVGVTAPPIEHLETDNDKTVTEIQNEIAVPPSVAPTDNEAENSEGNNFVQNDEVSDTQYPDGDDSEKIEDVEVLEPQPTEPDVPVIQPGVPDNPPSDNTNVEETTSETGGCYCKSDKYNCGDFATHAEAQALYKCCMTEVGYDVHGLDGNDNGLTCENLP